MTRGLFWIWDKNTDEVREAISADEFIVQMGDHRPLVVGRREVPTPDEWKDDTSAGTLLVSTVFLGINYNFTGEGDPVLWETMILGLPTSHELHEYTRRYRSYKEAQDGHRIAIRMLTYAMRNAGVGNWNWQGAVPYQFAQKIDWDEMARIVTNHIGNTDITQKMWRDAGDEFGPVKDKYSKLAQAVVEQYEKVMLRRNVVQIRRDDLEALVKLLGPARGAMVNRLAKILGRNPDETY